MTYLLSDIMQRIEALAPPILAQPWDKIGLQVGGKKQDISRVLFALDADEAALERCLEMGAELLVTHHPLIFNPLTSLCEEALESQIPIRLLRSGIALYAAHTNLDAAVGGVNDALAAVLGLRTVGTLFPACEQGGLWASEALPAGLVRLAELDEPLSFNDFVRRVNQHLQTPGCFMSGLDACEVRRVALSGGAYHEDWTAALAEAGVDALVSGEINYHQLLALEAAGVRAIAAGHDCTERPVLFPLAEFVREAFPELDCQVYSGLDYNRLWE